MTTAEPVFERLKTSIVSEKLFSTFGFIQSCVFSVTIVSFSLLVYVVFFHSPKRIGNYKWYILINVGFGFGFQTISVVFRPFPLLPYPILVIHGFADAYIFVMQSYPPQLLIDLLLNLVILCIGGFFYSTTSMFVYRYLQTTQNERLRSFSKLSNYLLSYVVFGVVFVVLVLVPLNMQFMSSDKLKESIKDVDPVAYERMKNYCVVGFSTRTGYYYLFGGIVLSIMATICCVTVLISIFLCYQFLFKHEDAFSKRTAKLYRSLLNMLVIDLCVAGFTGVVTLGLSLLSVVTYFESGSQVVLLSLAFADFYPLFTHILTIAYIEPYRVAFLSLIGLEKFARVSDMNVQTEATSMTKAPLFMNRKKRSVFFTKVSARLVMVNLQSITKNSH